MSSFQKQPKITRNTKKQNKNIRTTTIQNQKSMAHSREQDILTENIHEEAQTSDLLKTVKKILKLLKEVKDKPGKWHRSRMRILIKRNYEKELQINSGAEK